MSRTKYILSLIATLFSAAIMCAATVSPTSDYESNWNEVNKLMQKPLLKDARKKVQEIRTYATKADDEINILKCEVYDYAIDLGCEYNISSLHLHINSYAQITNLEEGEEMIINHYKKSSNLLKSLKSTEVKACCELFMAKILNDYIEVKEERNTFPKGIRKLDNYFKIDDLCEMTKGNIQSIIRAHTDSVTKNRETLLSTPSANYIPLFVCDTTGFTIDTHPTLLDIMLPFILDLRKEYIKQVSDLEPYYYPIQMVDKEIIKKDYLHSLFADVISHHCKNGLYTAALTAEFLRLSRFESYNNNPFLQLDYFDYILKLYEGKTPLVVDALIMKHEFIYYLIKSSEDTGIPRYLDSFPKQVIKEAEEYIKRYPDYPQIKELEQNIKYYLHPLIEAIPFNTCFGKGKDVRIITRYANIDTLRIDIFRSTIIPPNAKYNKKKEREKAKFVATKKFKLAPSNDRVKCDTILSIGNDLDYGKYFIYFRNKNKKIKEDEVYTTFIVTDLAILSATSSDKAKSAFVVDGETGHPVNGAKLENYDAAAKKLILKETQNTDAEGKAKFSKLASSDCHLFLLYTQKGKDNQSPIKELCDGYFNFAKPHLKLNLLTDRHIYRPGQTIEGKAILTFLSLEEERVMENKEINIILKDANNEYIDSIIAVTNEFGSAPFNFAIPTDRLNGTFTIEATYKDSLHSETERHRISVESYKRPTAEVIVDVKDGSPLLRNSILGFVGKIKTFSDEPVEDAVVKYRISTYYDEDNPLCHGETVCDAEGKYSFSTGKKIDVSDYWLDVYVDAVLPSGETVSGHKKIEIGTDSIYARIKLANNSFENKSPLRLNVVLRNNAQTNYDAEAVITIATKEDKSKNIESKTLITKKIKGNGEFQEDIDISSLAPAEYELKIKSLSDKNLSATYEIVVYDEKSTKLPNNYNPKLWISCGDGAELECTPSKKAEILIGSAETDAKILTIIRDEDGKIIANEWVEISNEQKPYHISFDRFFASHKTNLISIEFLIIRQHKLTRKSITVNRQKTSKKASKMGG